jgi:hypothetical protein
MLDNYSVPFVEDDVAGNDQKVNKKGLNLSA